MKGSTVESTKNIRAIYYDEMSSYIPDPNVLRERLSSSALKGKCVFIGAPQMNPLYVATERYIESLRHRLYGTVNEDLFNRRILGVWR